MGVSSKELFPATAHSRSISLTTLFTLLLAAWAAHLLLSTLFDLGQTWVNDVRYGRPRTTHVSGFVGHEEGSGQQTHLIGLNLDRQVVVLEIPGGDTSQVRALAGPYLFGARQELTPVNLALEDLDDDDNVDLLITVRDEQVVYLNKEGVFRLPTTEERRQLRSPQHE